MSRILLIGGYGGFGARLARRLAGRGHRVIVAGRSMERAAAFSATLPGAEPLVADRTNGIGLAMARERPDLVIDAAGPFQGSGHTVPEACIAMRIPYLDLADARDFVCGIGALDKDARRAGVPVISGASSVPALSGAVVRELAAGMARVDRVEMAISASNRASAGPSVAAAILSYVGRPVKLWRGRRWATGWGWQEMRRQDFLLPDGTGLRGRLTGIADVPDHAILPEALPGRPAVTFRAGTELGFQMRTLWLASWPVRWGWIASLTKLRGLLMPLYRATLRFGGDRSAMHVTLSGEAEGRAVERRWTLVASNGDGPEIPVLAAELLAEAMLAGRVAPGARHAGDELTLEAFAPLFAALAIRHATAERALPAPLYARILGDRFAALPPLVRAMHQVSSDHGARGEGTVRRGTSPAARMLAAMMGMPPAGTVPLHVHFTEADGRERWTRDFGGHRFTSELSARRGRAIERFGPLRFAFDLPADADGLRMEFAGWSAFGLPLPRWAGPRITAREWQEDGRFRFEVTVRMPLIGEVVGYSGWLEVD
ncbi:DUF4166 domain-containing protein [Sphingomonas canadensis]|uniref:DUF4166 domain-containing protein n=1 Tax=Sphingomonas canadensis TaxID=1219257 RepID=A0ABW3H7L8_9SPHN|nr:SDR family oxidoreductase [Sphingomonas canadensis]MCW3837046.1 DUF4166 domain-containing protein [Sphingomonas canadensis]